MFNFQALALLTIFTSVLTLTRIAAAIHQLQEYSMVPPPQYAGASLQRRKIPPAGPPPTDWSRMRAPRVLCTPTMSEGSWIVGVAALKERIDYAWLTTDSASVHLILFTNACRFLNQTIVQARGNYSQKNTVRWDLDRNSAVILSMDIMPVYQSAGYCPGGWNCTDTPSYFMCGPAGSGRITAQCSLTQGQLSLKTYAWGPYGNERDQHSNIWVSSATPLDACNCQASSSNNGLPLEYVYGCYCHINPNMILAMDGESSKGCREEERLGLCRPRPGPNDFIPTIPPPWINSPDRFASAETLGPKTPVRYTPPGYFTKMTKQALSHVSGASGLVLSHEPSLYSPHAIVPLSKLKSLKSSSKSTSKSTSKPVTLIKTNPPPSTSKSVVSTSSKTQLSTSKSITSTSAKSPQSIPKTIISTTTKSSTSTSKSVTSITSKPPPTTHLQPSTRVSPPAQTTKSVSSAKIPPPTASHRPGSPV